MTLEVAGEPVMGPDGMEDSETTFMILKVKPSQPGQMILEPENIEDPDFKRWTTAEQAPNLKAPRFDLQMILEDAVMEAPASPFEMVWDAILEHRRENPDCRYGSDKCPVIAAQIRLVRSWLQVGSNDPKDPVTKAVIEAKRDFDRVIRIGMGTSW
jgi:hypothetical protein